MRSSDTAGGDVGEGSPLVGQVVGQVARALEGAVFPLDRERLTWVARENDAPREVVSALQALPTGPFSSVDEVLQRLEAQAGQTPAGS